MTQILGEMEAKPADERTCNRCGWVAFGVTRAFAEAGVRRFNAFFDSSSDAVRESYGNRRSVIANYERCHRCGGPHTDFRDAVDGDCPVGCTLSPIIVEERGE